MTTPLLDTDGSASMATFIMSSHHAFRRDLSCFARALADVTAADTARLAALAGEWTGFRGALHGHHTIEDTSIFPDLRGKQPDAAAALETLQAQHHEIDPLLARGDSAFGDLAHELPAAREVIAALTSLLSTHLGLEEQVVIPHMRIIKTFDAPMDDAMVAMYAEGFAWSTAGLAQVVVDAIFGMLPPALVAALPAAQAAFDQRCQRVWGHTHRRASMTSSPA